MTNQIKKNVLVYVDYENLHKNFLKKYKNVFELEFFQKLKKHLESKNFNIIDIAVYCNFDIEDMHESYHQTRLQQLGLKTIHTCNNGKNYADIQIAADAVEQIYKNDIVDGFIIISNDKDMTPLIKTIKNNKEFVILITTEDDYDKNLLNFPTYTISLDDILSENIESISDDFKDNLYENLNNHIKSNFIDKNKEPIISLDKYLQNSIKFNKVFEYELYRQLNLLDKEGKVYIYTYEYNSKRNESAKYIVTDTYKSDVESCIDNNTYYSNINYDNVDDIFNKSYEKFIKKFNL